MKMKALLCCAALCFAGSWPDGAAAQAPSIESTDDGGVSITIAAGSQLRLITGIGRDDSAGESDNSAVVTLDVMLGYLDDMKQQITGLSTELADAKAELKALRADAVTNAGVAGIIKPSLDALQEKLDESKEVATQERSSLQTELDAIVTSVDQLVERFGGGEGSSCKALDTPDGAVAIGAGAFPGAVRIFRCKPGTSAADGGKDEAIQVCGADGEWGGDDLKCVVTTTATTSTATTTTGKATMYKFTYTGKPEFFTVPENGDGYKVEVHAWGGGGGSGHYGGSKPYTRSKYHTATVGGQGAYVTGQINAKPGQKFQVVVGGAGEDGWTERRNENTFGGGGIGQWYTAQGWHGGNGGGLSGIFNSDIDFPAGKAAPSSSEFQRVFEGAILIAGGGGGGGGYPENCGGSGGGTNACRVKSHFGTAGTLSGPGNCEGNSCKSEQKGHALVGGGCYGNVGDAKGYYAGGGGGGYYGGGAGGYSGGGGGGASYTSDALEKSRKYVGANSGWTSCNGGGNAQCEENSRYKKPEVGKLDNKKVPGCSTTHYPTDCNDAYAENASGPAVGEGGSAFADNNLGGEEGDPKRDVAGPGYVYIVVHPN